MYALTCLDFCRSDIFLKGIVTLEYFAAIITKQATFGGGGGGGGGAEI